MQSPAAPAASPATAVNEYAPGSCRKQRLHALDTATAPRFEPRDGEGVRVAPGLYGHIEQIETPTGRMQDTQYAWEKRQDGTLVFGKGMTAVDIIAAMASTTAASMGRRQRTPGFYAALAALLEEDDKYAVSVHGYSGDDSANERALTQAGTHFTAAQVTALMQ